MINQFIQVSKTLQKATTERAKFQELLNTTPDTFPAYKAAREKYRLKISLLDQVILELNNWVAKNATNITLAIADKACV